MKENFIPILSLPPTSKEIIKLTMPQQPQVNLNISQPPLNDLCADYNARG